MNVQVGGSLVGGCLVGGCRVGERRGTISLPLQFLAVFFYGFILFITMQRRETLSSSFTSMEIHI